MCLLAISDPPHDTVIRCVWRCAFCRTRPLQKSRLRTYLGIGDGRLGDSTPHAPWATSKILSIRPNGFLAATVQTMLRAWSTRNRCTPIPSGASIRSPPRPSHRSCADRLRTVAPSRVRLHVHRRTVQRRMRAAPERHCITSSVRYDVCRTSVAQVLTLVRNWSPGL
jgi:hypothetical protein